MERDEHLPRARVLAIRKLGVAPSLPTSGVIFALLSRLEEAERERDAMRVPR